MTTYVEEIELNVEEMEEMIAPGVVKRVYEAVYAKVLVAAFAPSVIKTRRPGGLRRRTVCCTMTFIVVRHERS